MIMLYQLKGMLVNVDVVFLNECTGAQMSVWMNACLDISMRVRMCACMCVFVFLMSVVICM